MRLETPPFTFFQLLKKTEPRNMIQKTICGDSCGLGKGAEREAFLLKIRRKEGNVKNTSFGLLTDLEHNARMRSDETGYEYNIIVGGCETLEYSLTK